MFDSDEMTTEMICQSDVISHKRNIMFNNATAAVLMCYCHFINISFNVNLDYKLLYLLITLISIQ